MYIPKDFRNTDEAIAKDFIRQHSFGILVSQVEGKLWATHTPMLLTENDTKLSGHIAKGNKQWKEFNGTEVLAIFSGAHSYVSSSWYDHENVPTWNYLITHVYGNVRIIEGEELYQSLKQLVDKYEKKSERPVAMEKFSPDFLKHEIQGVVGFEIKISRIESAQKLSQNRNDRDYHSIITHLEKNGDENSTGIASAMKNNRKLNEL
ncbi:protease synthase and sporulation protein PAI 2 [Cytophagales bacterium WSM2-2]|nr:protease synthase and sporulation protein PAI 2 [Cytophagales bacterium WSM2-2]